MTMITQTPEVASGLKHRRRWALPIAAVAVLLTAAGWAVLDSVSDSTSVQCPGNSIIDAVTGNPVLDCSNQWRYDNGTEPPPMVAYDNGQGLVVVLIEDTSVPDPYTALEPGPFQNTTLIELEAALGDVGTGLESGCFDEAAAMEITQRELHRLELTGWTITVDNEARPDGASSCAYFIVDAALQQVQLIGLQGATTPPNPYSTYSAALDEQLNADCVGLEGAADLARSLAAATEIVVDAIRIEFTEEAGVLLIHTVEDPDASCTRADVNVGGRVKVTLRGPAQ